MAWIGAAAQVGGALLNYFGSKKAADATEDAAKLASDTQLHMFDQNRADLAPWREAGAKTLGQITAGLQPGGEFAQSIYKPFTMADFMNDHGYQFQLQEGQKALERSAAAKGMLGSGATMKDIIKYGQGVASQGYNDAFNRYNADFNMRNTDTTTRFNRLASVAGLGQTATNQTAQLGADTARGVASNQIGAGNAAAAGTVAGTNAMSGAVGNIGNYFMTQNLLKQMGYNQGGDQ